MQLLWIENQSKWRDELYEILLSKFEVITISEDVLLKHEDDIATFIFREYSTVDLFIINLHVIVSGHQRLDNTGVKILKLIRLHNLRQHCIVYSFLTREHFMQLNSQNLILFSGGVTYHRLPDNLSLIPFNILVNKKTPDDLSPYLRAEFNLPDERHMLANWWGVLQLWKVHKAVEKSEGSLNYENIENHLHGSKKEMNSFQGLMAKYLYMEKEEDIEGKLKFLKKKQEELLGIKNIDIENIAQIKQKNISEYEKRENQIDILQKFCSDKIMGSSYIDVLEELKLISSISLQEAINDLIEKKYTNISIISELDKFDDIQKLIDQEVLSLKKKNEESDSEIREISLSLEKKKGFSTSVFNLAEVRKKLQNYPPKIIYVDDQANEGWAFVLKRMIYGSENESLQVIVPLLDDPIERIALNILRLCEGISPDLIILDLRLKGEIGAISEIEKISGFQVLQILKQQQVCCPILIFSASNKIWSYTETHKYGAAAYWTKEGIEDNKGLNRSIENYMHLLDLISCLCMSNEFKFLAECKKNARLLSQRIHEYWWEGFSWLPSELKYPKTRITVEREKVFSIIDESVDLIESLLHSQLQDSKAVELNKQIPSLIIAKLSMILELIHKTDADKTEEHGRIDLSEKVFDQLPALKQPQFRLINLRNQAVHSMDKSFKDLRQYFRQIFSYLHDCCFLDQITPNNPIPIKERAELTEPIDGNSYLSVVESIHPKYPNYIYLKNPGLLLARNSIVLNLDTNTHLSGTDFYEGDKIEFILKINTEKTPANYYAIKATKSI